MACRCRSLVAVTALLPLAATFSGPKCGFISRRDCIAATAASGVASFAPVWPAAAKLGRDPKLLQDNVVFLLRVKEATGQETRLINTGKYKELQRLNIKRAVSFILDNYALRDRFVAASVWLPNEQQGDALAYAGRAVESLVQILEYFPQDLQANDLSAEQKKFVLAALQQTSSNIDSFLTMLPQDAVEAAAKQVAEENQLNVVEYEEVNADKIINAPPPPPSLPPPPET